MVGEMAKGGLRKKLKVLFSLYEKEEVIGYRQLVKMVRSLCKIVA